MGQLCSWRPCAQAWSLGRQACWIFAYTHCVLGQHSAPSPSPASLEKAVECHLHPPPCKACSGAHLGVELREGTWKQTVVPSPGAEGTRGCAGARGPPR